MLLLFAKRILPCTKLICCKNILAIFAAGLFLFYLIFVKQNIRCKENVPLQISNSTKTVPKRETETDNFLIEMFSYSEDKIAEIYSSLLYGGLRKASNNNQHIAIIVPYRDRLLHLSAFLRHMHYFLNHQKTNYGIFIIEQIANQTFNRGKLMNVGFLEALKSGHWNCFIFHDVDLLPENLSNIYSCKETPTHFSSAVDKFNYSVPYEKNFGGVTAMTRSQFEKLNGFSNEFWGWGGEDDEILMRIEAHEEKFDRLSSEIGRYKMFRHVRDKGNEDFKCRFKRLNETRHRFHVDGLNNVKYTVLKKQKKHLYTHFLVDLLESRSKLSSSFKC